MKRARSAAPSAAEVQRAKVALFGQLVDGRPGSSSYLATVESELRNRLNIAFTQRVSTSLMVVGPVGSGKKRLVESLLDTYYVDKSKGGIAVARIKGLVCTTDQQALCSIADQFLLRSGVGFEKNVTVVLQDLEAHFRQCMIDGHPAVVLLEDIHIFAAREKQVLIYTLLDFMHKQDLLFVVVGLTPCAHLNSLLEKRVLSRLNAQFVYVPPVTGGDVLTELSRRLTLPETAAAGAADEEGAARDEGFEAYRAHFNAQVKNIFATAGASVSEGGGSGSGSGSSLGYSVRRYAEWGKGISHFLRAAQLAVALLGPEEPFLTAPALEAALSSQDPPSLAERLCCLPPLELRLFAAAARLHGRKTGSGAVAAAAAALLDSSVGADGTAGAGSGEGGGGGGGGGTPKKAKAAKKGDRGMTVDEVIRETELLTGALRTKETTAARLLQGLQALAAAGLVTLTNQVSATGAAGGRPAPVRLLSEKTHVVLLPPLYEVREALVGGSGGSSAGAAGGGGAGGGEKRVGRPVPQVVLSERIRSAVLEPLKTLSLG